MAAYFHGASEIQPEGLQTLYLMNPSYHGYSDAATPPTNMVLLNSPTNPLNLMSLSHNSQQNQPQHLVGIPLQSSLPPQVSRASHEISAAHGLAPSLHYNLWSSAPQPNNSIDMSSTLQQGLSLSLSREVLQSSTYADEAKLMGSQFSAPAVPDGVSGLQSVLLGSKYLKAAQLLLDEVASVGRGTRGELPKRVDSKSPMKSSRGSEGVGEAAKGVKQGVDLTAAERQELQMKKAKLVNMLDEVEQKYRQYHHQMQIVVSSFESVAGSGSARTYTALALQTISKQFRWLRDAIVGVIFTTSKSLGEEDCSAGGTKSTGSRLRFVDHHLRQQRALQQLGMIQHNAWRPQRGLPERAVSVLRAWLFEHFLHPYPKDSDKHMLAKQTGLTRSQVSNWFINARVRLWKPMVEEMYLEEFKDQEQNNADEKARKSDAEEASTSKSSDHQERSPTQTDQADSLKSKQDTWNDPIHRSITITPLSYGAAGNHETIMQPSLKKVRNNDESTTSFGLKPDEMSNRELLMRFMDGRASGDHLYPLQGIGAYPIGEIGRFDNEQFAPSFMSNGVSLTLGLPHTESITLSGSQQSYLSAESISLRRPADSHPPNAYESINIQERKRFAAQLLPDFVT